MLKKIYNLLSFIAFFILFINLFFDHFLGVLFFQSFCKRDILGMNLKFQILTEI